MHYGLLDVPNQPQEQNHRQVGSMGSNEEECEPHALSSASTDLAYSGIAFQMRGEILHMIVTDE